MAFVKIGVVNGLAVPSPPVFDGYQTTFPVVQVADNEAVVPLQMVVPAAVGAAGFGFTVTTTVVLGLTQFGVPPDSQAEK